MLSTASFTLERTLHEGQFMRVELAVCGGSRYTRKVLVRPTPFMHSRFVREGVIAQRLEHPNIVRCFGADDSGIVYEYLEGASLREVLNTEGSLGEARALCMVRSILSGVAYAHARGVYHLDLKPENVMICEDGERVKLIDFGLAKDVNLSGITGEGDRLGTPHYMAPEQFQGQRDEARSDLFSIAAILFELVTGRVAFQNPFAWMYGEATLSPLQTHPALERLIRWGLEPRPEHRPASALAYLVALEGVLETLQGEVQDLGEFDASSLEA